MGVYKNGYSVMIEPITSSFEEYIVLLKNFLLEKTPWTIDEDKSSSNELFFDTGYETVKFSRNTSSSMYAEIATKCELKNGVKSGRRSINITTNIEGVIYSTCTLYAFVKEGITIWRIFDTVTMHLPSTAHAYNNETYTIARSRSSYGVGVCQLEFNDIINNRITQARALLFGSNNYDIFMDYSAIGMYQLQDGSWDWCYLILDNYRRQVSFSNSNINPSVDHPDSLTLLGNKLYFTRLMVSSYNDPKKIIGFIPQIGYLNRPHMSAPRIYYPFKNDGYIYQYIDYPVCYIRKDGE